MRKEGEEGEEMERGRPPLLRLPVPFELAAAVDTAAPLVSRLSLPVFFRYFFDISVIRCCFVQ